VGAAAALVLIGAGACASGRSGDASARAAAAAAPNRFDERAAWRFLRWQVALGPRPAGSPRSRTLAARLRRDVPGARYERVPGGLRNVVARVRGRNARRVVVVGAHYDTKNILGFVGANDGAAGTAVVRQLARTIRPREARSTLVFVFFDGEESPFGTPDAQFAAKGLRGSKVAAKALGKVDAMVLVDFVGDKNLSLPRESTSSRALWAKLRAAARRAGTIRYFPAATAPGVLDDHTPFQARGVPAIDLIDFDFACFHQLCDDLSAVSPRSLDVAGETLVPFLKAL
jgi:glutaminyl-peptide cyclotransferase